MFKLTTSKAKPFCGTSSFFLTWPHLKKRSKSAQLPQFLTWSYEKRSNSSRLPQGLELDNVKKEGRSARLFSIFELGNVKNKGRSARLPLFLNLTRSTRKAVLLDFRQKWKGECIDDRLVPLRFAIFHDFSTPSV